MESAVYGHLGTSSLAAYTLTGPIQGLMVGALSGLSAAAGVIVGKRLAGKNMMRLTQSQRRLCMQAYLVQ